MSGELAVLALLVFFGLAGGFVLGRNTAGARALAAWLLWLPVPFVILAATLAGQIDPSLPANRASYNFAFGFVLVSLLVAVPWLASNLVGALVGRRFRASGRAVPPQPASPPPADPDLPDWRHADQPSLSLEVLGQLMRRIAARAGIEERLLPHIGPIADREGTFLDRDKFDYIYIGLERGIPMFDHRSVIADEVMYRVFSDVAFGLANTRFTAENIADPAHRERVEAERQAILAGIDPRWGRQFALERARKAGG